jgi:NADH dehydrogenase FAD-containing subunit
MGKHLVLAGGGHAHMMVLAHVGTLTQSGVEVTVVQPSPHHYYSGMGPGMLGGFYQPDQIRFDTRKTVQSGGGTFLEDRVQSIDPAAKTVSLASGRHLTYDALSLNIGSEVSSAVATDRNPEDVFFVKPIEGLIQARDRFLSLAAGGPVDVAVIGGGPSAAEICGNLMGLAQRTGVSTPKIRMFARRKMLSNRPPSVVRRVRRSLEARGVLIEESTPVRRVQSGRIWTEAGDEHQADLIFMATGVKPPRLIADSGLPTGANGGLLVNGFLQCPTHPEVFGGGDCICLDGRPLDKVGVYAVRQNPVLLANLQAALSGGTLQRFDPGGGYLLIYNLGDGTGVLHRGPIVLSGRLAYRIKDFIDRRFVRRFQNPAVG